MITKRLISTTDECLCTGNARNGDLRLDPDNGSQGYVQVYYNGTWGTICGAASLSQLAAQTCNMLGYPAESDSAFYSLTGRSKKFLGPPMLWNVSCEGNPSNFLNCNSAGWHNVPQKCRDDGRQWHVTCQSK